MTLVTEPLHQESYSQASLFKKTAIDVLLQKALASGASDAAIIDSSKIKIQEKLAKLCEKPRCPFHGLAGSCPPSVGGPELLRCWIEECAQAIVIRIDVPVDILYSSGRIEIMAFLHELTARIEKEARSCGYPLTKAFAGGSCKELFCSSYANCRKISSTEGCRNPGKARPSMSGYGIDVGHLMTLANWRDKQLLQVADNGQKFSWIAGLILIG